MLPSGTDDIEYRPFAWRRQAPWSTSPDLIKGETPRPPSNAANARGRRKRPRINLLQGFRPKVKKLTGFGPPRFAGQAKPELSTMGIFRGSSRLSRRIVSTWILWQALSGVWLRLSRSV